MVDASVFAQAPLYSSWQIYKKIEAKVKLLQKVKDFLKKV